MKCPRDNTMLQSTNYEGAIAVDTCTSCGGMWLDQGELQAIEASREHDYSAELARMPDLGYNAYELALQKQQRSINCPKCHVEMESREYARCSQVMIDVCPQCHGVWLDRGESEALEVFFERSHLETHRVRLAFLAGLRRP